MMVDRVLPDDIPAYQLSTKIRPDISTVIALEDLMAACGYYYCVCGIQTMK